VVCLVEGDEPVYIVWVDEGHLGLYSTSRIEKERER
jgi:hypothetical protein